MNFSMGHLPTSPGGITAAMDGYRKFLRDAQENTGRPHPYEARARDDAKEVLGRHVHLWWQSQP
jgi:hypothetical protein